MVGHFQEEHIGKGPVGDCFIKLTGARRCKTGHAKARPAEPNSYSVNNDDEPPSISSPHVDIDRSSDDESNDKYVEGHPTEHTTRGCGSGAGESLPSQPVPKEQIKNIEGCSTEQTSETSDCQVSVLNKDAASEDLCSTPLLQHSEPCPSSSDKQPYNVSNDHLYTSAELDKLNQISMECQKLFPVDGKIIYDNPKVLKKQLQDSIGDKYGFVVALISSRIECLNANAPKHSKKRTEKRHAVIPPTSRRARKTTRCGCPFSIKFTPLNYKDRRDDKRVVITKANYEHTNGCRPSSMQLVQQHVQSGTFSRRGPQVVDKSATNIMTTLLNMMRYEEHVSAKTLRNVLKEHLPEAVPVDAVLIANVRARAILHMKNMKTDENGKIPHHATITSEDADTII